MHMWAYPVTNRDRIVPVSRIIPYARITSNLEQNPEAEEQSRMLQKEELLHQMPMSIDPPLTNYARHAAILVQASLDVADQAAGLLSLDTFPVPKLQAYMEAVEELQAFIESSEIDYLLFAQDDPFYLKSDIETIEYWDKIARHVLEISPLELMNDDQPLQSYMSYSEDKQKTWRFPHQGLIMQSYG